MLIDEEKAAVRAGLRRVRKAAALASGPAAAAAVAGHLAAALSLRDVVVAGYIAAGSEISALPVLERLAAEGCRLALPVVPAPATPLVFRAWQLGEALSAGHYGILAPAEGAADVVPDVVLVPLLGFDRRGGRLGQGGGFYDRTIPRLRAQKPNLITIGLAFSVQEVASVPRAETDAALDWIVTDAGAIEVVG